MPARQPGSSAPPPHRGVGADRAAAARMDLEVEVGRAAAGVAGGPDPGDELAGLDALAEADQVVVVVGIVVSGAAGIPQPQADPAPTPIEVAEAGDGAAGHRDQGGAGGGEQVDA